MELRNTCNGKKKQSKPRAWEIDLVRGLFIVGVVIHHTLVDCDEFIGTNFNSYLHWLSNFAAMFIFICGMCCTFSRNNLKRGGILLLVSLGITAVTYWYNSFDYVRFGILHLLAVSILLYHFIFRRLGSIPLGILSAASLGLWKPFENMVVKHPYFIPFGATPSSFQSMDYFPIFPWMATFIIGIIIARKFYPKGESLFGSAPKWLHPLLFIGKHTLIIYVAQQPLMYCLFQLFMI